MTTRANFLKTFRDVIEHLTDWIGASMTELEARRARRAIMAASRKMSFDGPWKYFKDDVRINLDAPYTTGTVAYDHTGGATERRLTLSGAGAAWPDWAAYGRILIGSDTVIYKVSDRVSASVLTLDATANPQADVAAGATFTLFRSEYPLPEVHRVWNMSDESGYWQSTHVTPEEWMSRERVWRTSGKPFYWTLMGGRDFYGSMGIRMSGYPDAAQTLDFIATLKMRRLVIDGVNVIYNSGTGTVTAASGTSITITGNTLTNEVVGAIIRLSRNSSVPTDVEGGNGYIDQRVITAISAAGGNTTITVDDTIDTSGITIGTGYCISDPIDLPEQLYDLLLAWAEYEYACMAAPQMKNDAAAALNGKLGARQMARAWDNQAVEPAVASPWSHPMWALLQGTITTAGGDNLYS